MTYKPVMLAAFMIICSSVSSQSLDEKLNAIADFADRICIPKGARTDVQLHADLRFAANGLVSKVINAGGSASVERHWYEYAGVEQEKVEGKTLDPAGCRQEVSGHLFTEILGGGN